MAVKERIFNNRPRKVFRKRIPVRETVSSAVVFCVLLVAGVWFMAQRSNFDAAERDISTEVLQASAVEDTLYRAPLQRWTEPGQGGATQAGPELGIYPASILDGGWEPTARLQEFTPETLYEKIDGAAEQFIQFGFQKMHYISVGKPADGMDVSAELYDMGSFQNALGIFAAQRDTARTTEKAGAANYYATEAGAIALFGRYYLKVAGNDSKPAVQEKAVQIVADTAKIAQGASDVPRAYAILSDALGIPFDGIAYERADVFQFGFAKDFWFGVAPDAPDTRFFLHEAADGPAAAALFERLAAENQYDYDVVQQGEQDLVLKHKYLNTIQVLGVRNACVLGVDNAADAPVAAQLFDRLVKALEGANETEAAS